MQILSLYCTNGKAIRQQFNFCLLSVAVSVIIKLSIYQVCMAELKELVLTDVNGKRKSTWSCLFSMPKGLEFLCTIVCNIRHSKLPRISRVVREGAWKLTGPSQRTRPVRPQPVLSVLRTNPFHLRTGRSNRPVLTSGKRPNSVSCDLVRNCVL